MASSKTHYNCFLGICPETLSSDTMSPTPILDLKQEPPKTRRAWVQWAITVLISAIFLAPFLAGLMTSRAPACNGLLWLPAIYLAIAIHEIGHLTAGKLAGMEPGGINIGGFQLLKSGPRWVFRFDITQGVCGFAKPLPPKGDFRRDHFAWMVAGGPIASVALTALCTLVLLKFGSGTWDWISTLFWGSTIGVSSLIPYSAAGVRSDGALLWQLFTHPERSRRWIALLALQTEEADGILPRNWDPELMAEVLKADSSDPHYPAIQMLAAYRAVDQHDPDLALQDLENALAASSRSGNKKLRHWCFLEAASASARERKTVVQARVWLERARKLQTPRSTAGIEAEIAMTEGRFEDAIQHWAAAREFITRRGLDSGLARFAKERISERERACNASLSDREAAGSQSQFVAQSVSPPVKEARPVPWLTIAAVALVAITILAAIALR